MKNLVRIVGVCLIAALCSFAAEWTTVQNKPGNFKVLFPQLPKETEKLIESKIGPLEMKSFVSKSDDVAYALTYVTYPDSIVYSGMTSEDIFKGSIEGIAEGVKGTIGIQKAISLSGYTGKESQISFADGKGIINLRVYWIKSRTYFLQVGYRKEKEVNAAIDKFFNSFELMP